MIDWGQMEIHESFANRSIDTHWNQVIAGGAYIRHTKDGLRLGYDMAAKSGYTDAQLDDYTMRAKKDYLWQPPLRMTVRARFSHPAADADSTDKTPGTLKGTAGFGFWNKPFTMQGDWFTLPQAAWFFHTAPPSNMALDPSQPGWGWKAQVVNTKPARSAAYLLPTIAAAVRGRLNKQKNTNSQAIKHFTGSDEKILSTDMREWHNYEMDWTHQGVSFRIDNETVFETKESPSKPLGFVIWLDNEFAEVNFKGDLKFGKVDAPAQWLDVESIEIKNL